MLLILFVRSGALTIEMLVICEIPVYRCFADMHQFQDGAEEQEEVTEMVCQEADLRNGQ